MFTIGNDGGPIVQIAAFYKANSCCNSALVDFLSEMVIQLDTSIPFVVMGDFNIDALSKNKK
jgi:endonuclease/exonuclease/phosphatase family metal-dependent hydrolase